ncbi:unnamed protein product [Brassica rapa subsp. trilocularis]
MVRVGTHMMEMAEVCMRDAMRCDAMRCLVWSISTPNNEID